MALVRAWIVADRAPSVRRGGAHPARTLVRLPEVVDVGSSVLSQPFPQGRGPKVLLLTHTFGFPEGYAATLRARLMSRALVEAGAGVRVFCTRYSEIAPDVLNTQLSGFYEGVEFRYTTGNILRSSSFLKRRAIDSRGLASALSSILRMRRAGELDVVYLWSTASRWNLLSQIYVSFLNSLRIPIVLELNERPWSQAPQARPVEKVLSPLHGATGVIAISDYLEAWANSEALRLRREVPALRVPILVDTEEAYSAPPMASRAKPFVLFACPAGRSQLFRFAAEAMRRVWRDGRECDLVIVGPSRHDDRNRWLADLPTDTDHGSVVWLGKVSRATLLDLYQQARALLLPLNDELNSEARFPTKLGEYLASGTPVVASSRGELCRFVEDGDTAYLSTAGNAEGFGQRVVDVLDDAIAAREVGRRGRELAVREFDYRRYGAILREWFAAVAEGRRMP